MNYGRITLILNVPASDEFEEQGLVFLNLAFDLVINLLLESFEIESQVNGNSCINVGSSATSNENTSIYWKAARNSLSVAQSLAQQGAELILKAKIASISPFLLFADWPRCLPNKNAEFSDFRTVDSKDLVPTYNAINANGLPREYVVEYEKYRKTRNAVLHSVDKRVSVSERDVILYILRTSDLVARYGWRNIRKNYIDEMPVFQAYDEADSSILLCREIDILIGLLSHAELIQFFDFNKKQRRYTCPNCWRVCNSEAKCLAARTALLRPNKPTAKTVYCFVCDRAFAVSRSSCKKSGCKGNVIYGEDVSLCLTCQKED